MWYCALSLCCAGIRRLGIILTPYATFVPNFVSVATSVAELAHGVKSRSELINHSSHSLTHPPIRSARRGELDFPCQSGYVRIDGRLPMSVPHLGTLKNINLTLQSANL